MDGPEEKIGDLGEQIIRTMLKYARFSVQRNETLDRQKVDLLVVRHYGKLLPRPLEIQITRRRDAAEKMREYLAAGPMRPNAIRVYLEMAAHKPPTEDIQRDLVNLITGWATHPPETPRFVRLSQDASLYSALDARIKRLETLLDPTHPNRVDAIITCLHQNEVEVLDEHGAVHRLPYGALQDPGWNHWLRSCYKSQEIEASPLCGLSLVLNQKDRDGHAVYAAFRKPAAYRRLWPAYEKTLLTP